MQFALEVAVLECILQKHSQGILGVNLLHPRDPKMEFKL
jgi:hypothetical protein